MYLFTERFLYLFDILLANLFEFVLSMKAKVHAFMLIMGIFFKLIIYHKMLGILLGSLSRTPSCYPSLTLRCGIILLKSLFIRLGVQSNFLST